MPSIRIEPNAYLGIIKEEFNEDLKASGVLGLIEKVQTGLYGLFIADMIPTDVVGWALDQCGVPPVNAETIKRLEKERDELLEELMKYRKEDKPDEEKKRKKAENASKK